VSTLAPYPAISPYTDYCTGLPKLFKNRARAIEIIERLQTHVAPHVLHSATSDSRGPRQPLRFALVGSEQRKVCSYSFAPFILTAELWRHASTMLGSKTSSWPSPPHKQSTALYFFLSSTNTHDVGCFWATPIFMIAYSWRFLYVPQIGLRQRWRFVFSY
jgi:hypothetical protein